MADNFSDLVAKFEHARRQLEELFERDSDPSVETVARIDAEIASCFEALTQLELDGEALFHRSVFLVGEIDRLSIDNTLTRQICTLLLADLEKLQAERRQPD